MIKMPPCDLPMVPLAAEIVQGFLVTIGKNGTNSTIGRFTDFTIRRTPNVAIDQYTSLVFVFLIYFMYIVLFITFSFACMTKVLLIYEIHDIF